MATPVKFLQLKFCGSVDSGGAGDGGGCVCLENILT
jgi:hypothetical protein